MQWQFLPSVPSTFFFLHLILTFWRFFFSFYHSVAIITSYSHLRKYLVKLFATVNSNNYTLYLTRGIFLDFLTGRCLFIWKYCLPVNLNPLIKNVNSSSLVKGVRLFSATSRCIILKKIKNKLQLYTSYCLHRAYCYTYYCFLQFPCMLNSESSDLQMSLILLVLYMTICVHMYVYLSLVAYYRYTQLHLWN